MGYLDHHGNSEKLFPRVTLVVPDDEKVYLLPYMVYIRSHLLGYNSPRQQYIFLSIPFILAPCLLIWVPAAILLARYAIFFSEP